MRIRISKILFSVVILIYSIIFISCNLDNVPTAYKPEYGLISSINDILFDFNGYNGYMEAFYGYYYNKSDTNYQMNLIAGFYEQEYSPNQYHIKSDNVGNIHIAGIGMAYSDTVNKYYLNTIYYKSVSFSAKSDSAKLFFGTTTNWSIDSNKNSYLTFQKNIYMPKTLMIMCNYKFLDTISKNTDLTFTWEPDKNIKTRMAVIMTNLRIYNDTTYFINHDLIWHQLIEDNGSIYIPKESYLQHMKSGVHVLITFGRGYEEIYDNLYKKIKFRLCSTDSYEFVIK